MKILTVEPSPSLRGEIQVPGDKSISHRAVMFSALSQGTSVLRGLLMGEDVLSTIACFRELGVAIDVQADQVTIQGVGLRGLKAPAVVLDCGNSGTTLRLMMGILAGQPFVSRLTGDASLNRRPIERVAEPLRAMGAEISELRTSPTERIVKIDGRPLRGIRYLLPMASAQVKSAVLLAGLFAQGETVVVEPLVSRDHTEILLQAKGVPISKTGIEWNLKPGSELKAMDMDIPGDISSAAFFLVGGLLGKNSEVLLKNVGVNPTRTGLIDVLEKMGAKLRILPRPAAGGEAIADIEVFGSTPLKAVEVSDNLIPRLIDEIPILAVAMGAALGKSQVRDAAELRVKESDRIAAIEREMGKAGLKITSQADGFSVEGPSLFQSFRASSGGDHRIAMSLAIAATQAPGPSQIEDVGCIATSYPEFFEQFRALGGRLAINP